MSASIVKALKEEICRLSRKETRIAIEPVRRQLAQARRAVAEMKGRVDALERACREKTRAAAAAAPVAGAEAGAGKSWISGKGVRSMRKATGLTLAEFAQLAGVTPKAVSLWEAKPGALNLRQATKATLLSLRGIGVREARRRLEAGTQA